MGKETMKVARRGIVRPSIVLYTWESDEEYDSETETFTVTLKIHGSIYAQATGKILAEAYKKLVSKISPALSRATTIASLVGGQL